MTLKEWATKYNEHVTTMRHGGTCIADRTRTPDADWELYHLDDYAVSSVQAGTVWLVPKRNRVDSLDDLASNLLLFGDGVN